MKNLLTLLTLHFLFIAFAQNLSAIGIPEELSKNAYAVIRKDETIVNFLAPNKVERKKDFIITVIDRSGIDYAQAVEFYSPQIKINQLDVVYYDQWGKLIKKFKEKDFLDQSYIPNGQMYADYRVKYLNYVPTKYPFTVHIKSQITNTSTWIPSWTPLTRDHVSIESSTFTLNNPKNLKIHSKELNLKEYGIASQNPSESKIHYELKNQKPHALEDLMPVYSQIFPNVEFSAEEFEIDGVKGKFSNWSEMGKWYNQLLSGTQDLTPSQKSFFQNLVKDAKSDKEKVQILYKYLQNKTRYIGVQLGIGGLKPFPASYVESKSYGDCKALTNYMQSILDAVGIKSYYTIVQSGRREDFHTDFASIAQGDHVILYVPLENEDIWLETTSQQSAFNYLGSFTDNRNVLVIYPEGGKIMKTQKFPYQNNTEKTTGKFEVLPDGKMLGQFESVFGGLQYQQNMRVYFEPAKDQRRILMSRYSSLPNLTIQSYDLNNNWEEALFTQKLELESQQFSKTFGNNMTVNILPIGSLSSSLKKSNSRNYPFEIQYGSLDEMVFELKIPNHYKMDGVFDPIELTTEFGSYQLSLQQNSDQTFTITRKLTIKEGIYSKDKFNDYVEFRRKIASFDNSKILLEKI